MEPKVQIVGRLPVELNRRVRAAAQKREISLNAFLIEALTKSLPTDAVRHVPRAQKVVASKATA
ncbi:MAG: toxin-antitoxin system HicB family antitoxin [Vicinamibacterales bacterium]|nr:toxin-antitoxin system HicB family antitoxin [Vicinamibacterales bacterium]